MEVSGRPHAAAALDLVPVGYEVWRPSGPV